MRVRSSGGNPPGTPSGNRWNPRVFEVGLGVRRQAPGKEGTIARAREGSSDCPWQGRKVNEVILMVLHQVNTPAHHTDGREWKCCLLLD